MIEIVVPLFNEEENVEESHARHRGRPQQTFSRLVGLETAPLGFTTLCCAVFGLGGRQLIGMGVLGEYVGRIFEEGKRRPLVVVRRDAVDDAATACPTRRAA